VTSTVEMREIRRMHGDIRVAVSALVSESVIEQTLDGSGLVLDLRDLRK
jgi:hypothetical protein